MVCTGIVMDEKLAQQGGIRKIFQNDWWKKQNSAFFLKFCSLKVYKEIQWNILLLY